MTVIAMSRTEIDRMSVLHDLEASRAALSRSRYQPQAKERRLSCSPPSDISNWPKP
jgi:hypothetical protein